MFGYKVTTLYINTWTMGPCNMDVLYAAMLLCLYAP